MCNSSNRITRCLFYFSLNCNNDSIVGRNILIMGKMDYELFCEKMQQSLQRFYGEDVNVLMQPVKKNNGVILIGVTVYSKDSVMMPTMYLEPFYEMYKEGKELGEIVRFFVERYENSKVEGIDFSFFYDYEKVKPLLSFKLINYEMNRELLEQVPHQKYLDLAVIFHSNVCNDIIGTGAVTIRNEHLEIWGITKETLFQDALENMPRIYPVEFMNMAQMLKQLYEDEEGLILDELPMYVLTNTDRIHGASSLLYQNQLDTIWDVLLEDYYILPSSVHELIILPKRNGTEENYLSQMVNDINCHHVEQEEILSNHAYFYAHGMQYPICLPLIPTCQNACN